MKTATQCVRFESNDDPHCSISPPIYQTATFRQPSADEFGEYDYTRTGNPTRSLVERQIARLEGAGLAGYHSEGTMRLCTSWKTQTADLERIAQALQI